MPCRIIPFPASVSPQLEDDDYSPSFARAALCCYLLTVVFYFWVFERLFPNTDPGGVFGLRRALTLGLVSIGPIVVSIPVRSVTEISYGQDVHRRVGAAIGLAVVSLGIGALMALTKSKKHFYRPYLG